MWAARARSQPAISSPAAKPTPRVTATCAARQPAACKAPSTDWTPASAVWSRSASRGESPAASSHAAATRSRGSRPHRYDLARYGLTPADVESAFADYNALRAEVDRA